MAAIPITNVKTIPIKPKQAIRRLNADEIEMLLDKGSNFVSVGDFASARIVFGRVAEAGDARGALAFASTYDPIALGRFGAKGATPDVEKARQWYAKARELGSRDAGVRLAALSSTAKEPVNGAAGNSSPHEVPAPTASFWKSGDSTLRLEAAGVSRKFIFFEPSDAELKAGAKAGSLRFDGQIAGKAYTGTAYLYSDRCGRSAFQVSGQIENDGGRVVLMGRAPQTGNNCRELGKTDQTLVFDFVQPSPK